MVTEKLELPSTDQNVAAIRSLATKAGGRDLAAWVLDEKKAYRQVAISPAHRKYSVVAFRRPISRVIAFFVMIGHSFGLVAAVYNYNRRSAMIDEFLRIFFGLVSFNFYDDKFGFELAETIESALDCARDLHTWLGAKFDDIKTQIGRAVDILGVTYELKRMISLIKEGRIMIRAPGDPRRRCSRTWQSR